jgi:creatinine amidohydrolase
VTPEESLRLLGARIASIPDALEAALAVPMPPLPEGEAVTTGGGLSEGPARALAALLPHARYRPLSYFAGPPLPSTGATLVLFSQGLAPNARLPLLAADRFARTVVFTSVAADAGAGAGEPPRLLASAIERGVEVVRLPPAAEAGLLLRVVGPAVATLAAARFAGVDMGSAPDRYRAALAAPIADGLDGTDAASPIALVACDADGALYHGLRWKLLEGLRVEDPPVWDLLQIAHGPLQSFFARAQTLIALATRGRAHEAAMLERLRRVIDPARHRLVVLEADSDGALGLLEHDARLNRFVEARASSLRIDLSRWPAQDEDRPLYDIERPFAAPHRRR